MSSKALVFGKFGEPTDVLEIHQVDVPACGDNEAHIRWLRAPINPSDINVLQGKYPLRPALPGVPGNEGVGLVTGVGAKVQNIKPGQHVVPLAPSLGTWRTEAVVNAESVHVVPTDLHLDSAATLCINPPSALAMLESIVELKEGDVVIQNGATSAVGQAVIQLARAKGLRTVNVIRDRPNWDETVAVLKSFGADVVTTEERAEADLASSGLPAPRLALNCVGGSSGLALAKLLGDGGTHVTYGAMGMAPLPVPASLLIFKDIHFRGFWLSGREARAHGLEARKASLDRLAKMYIDGALKPPSVQLYPLDAYKEAFAEVKRDFKNHKVLFDMTG